MAPSDHSLSDDELNDKIQLLMSLGLSVNNILFFIHNGQALPDAVNFVRSQIDHKLRLVDGRATSTRMVNASNVTQRKAKSSGDCEKDFLSFSSSAEELEQTNADVLLLNQDACQLSREMYAGAPVPRREFPCNPPLLPFALGTPTRENSPL